MSGPRSADWRVHDADGEDLVHEVFLKVHAHFANYDNTRPMRPWPFAFVYRAAVDHCRLARRRPELLVEQAGATAETIRADERIVSFEQRELELSAPSGIEFDRRAVVVTHDIDEVPAPRIAEMLDIPLNTAYSRLRWAREQLAAAVTRLRLSRGIR